MRLILDFGNSRGKWYAPKLNVYGDFLHAVYKMTDQEWESVAGRGKPPKGFLKINGAPYAVGDSARRYVLKDAPKGAARYNELYYGAALSYAMVEAFDESCKVQLYASHAPQDEAYATDIITAARRVWTIESYRGVYEFEVNKVITFDEPIGGYTHLAFNQDGTLTRNNPVLGKIALIIDVGGYTTDKAIIEKNGQVDPLSIESRRVGTIKAIKDFESNLRKRYKALFKDAGDLDIERVEYALINGVYPYGNQQLDCQVEAGAALNELVNEVIAIIKAAGGAANFDVIPLTGGGSALIYNRLQQEFPTIDFIPVEKELSLLKFANVFGGAKLAVILSRQVV